jgi:hypothetical protein
MWYFLHEISKKNIREVIKFLKKYINLRRFAQVIVGGNCRYSSGGIGKKQA